PGVSLLDFAKWDGDRPHGKASAESSGEAEPSPGAEAPGDAPSRHSGPGAEPFPRLRTPEPRRFPAEPGGAAEALPQGKTPADDPARTQGQDKDPVSRLRAPEARRIPAEGEATAPPETAGFDPVHKSQAAAAPETATTEHRDDPSAEIMTAARPVDAAAASGGRPQAEDADVPAAAAPLEGTGDRPASLPAAGVGAKLPEPESYAPATSRPATPPQERRGNDISVLEKLPVPVLVHSGDALHYANAEFLMLTGYGSVAELAEAGGIGALFVDPFDGENQPELRDRQLLLRKRQGEEFPVKAFLQSVPWNGGKALLLVLERSLAGSGPGPSPLVEELEAHVAEMRTIIDTATDGVVLIALDGTIRSISRPAEALFGFDSDEVAGKPFASLFAIESQRAARDYLAGLSDHGVASVLNDGREVIGREAEGRFIPLFMTIGRLPAGSGYCAVVRDITQWKRAEEDLTKARATAERASAHKTEFLARISHEIRTPLNAIIGFSELMMDEKFGPVANDRYRDYLRDINRSGNHVLDLVNDLLDISKIEAGQQDMAYEAVSLNETLAETVAMMQPQANRERVIIRSSLASRLPDVVADLRSVRQIALNLLSNAVRYTQAGGQVIVSTSYEPAGEVVMRVRDTGIGMTQAEIEQALKPFKQITSLKRARGDGTGLGLPLTKAMVEANRAKFSIHSTPGEGTLVEVSFPSTRVLAQ
ncbi:MAG: domain S-box protein, partial [Rhizobiaceae bacterium]|nr:domain S-box protein [Rhizobiaceae bacterium]